MAIVWCELEGVPRYLVKHHGQDVSCRDWHTSQWAEEEGATVTQWKQ
jgi:hypothetical protein